MKLTRVPPGQSVEFALAKKAIPVPTPTPDMIQGGALPYRDVQTVEESFALGNFCLQTGKFSEAIEAFEKTVRLDPNYADAWFKLSQAYLTAGDKEKSGQAMMKYKELMQR